VATVRYERRISADPDTVWSVFCEPDSIPEWFPGVVSCTVEGNIRTITLGTGLSMPEEILTVDPLLRRFQYKVTSPLYHFHLGTIDVIALGPLDSLCVYSTTAVPDALALITGGATDGALDEIKRMAEDKMREQS
jgi:ligand-binding SRPBCC domain-containing protein